jgi:hypothetical protein
VGDGVEEALHLGVGPFDGLTCGAVTLEELGPIQSGGAVMVVSNGALGPLSAPQPRHDEPHGGGGTNPK